jgi:hypothetical protein
VALTKATINGLDSLNDLADATGATVGKLSALEDVALRTGSSMDVAVDIVLKLNKALESADPGSNIEEAFKAIGLSVAELKKLDPADLTLKVAQALAKFADNGNKARIEQVILGKLTKEGAAYMKDLGEQTELVAKRTKEETDQAEKLNKEFFKLQATTVNLARDLAGPLVSSMNNLIEKFRQANKEGKNLAQILGERFSQSNKQSLLFGGNKEGGATGSWGEGEDDRPSAPVIKNAAAEKSATAALKKAADERRKLRVDAAQAELDLAEITARETAEAWSYWNKSIIANSQEKADALILQNAQVLEFQDQQQKDAIAQGEAYLNSLKKTGATVGEELSLVFSSAAGEAIANFKDLRGVLKGVLADIGQILTRQLITKPLNDLLMSTLGSVGFRATGGPVSSGSAYIVGERGPELFLPNNSGRIVPNGAGGITITSAPVITIDSRTDSTTVGQIVAQAVRMGNEQLLGQLKASGVMA